MSAKKKLCFFLVTAAKTIRKKKNLICYFNQARWIWTWIRLKMTKNFLMNYLWKIFIGKRKKFSLLILRARNLIKSFIWKLFAVAWLLIICLSLQISKKNKKRGSEMGCENKRKWVLKLKELCLRCCMRFNIFNSIKIWVFVVYNMIISTLVWDFLFWWILTKDFWIHNF